MVTLSSSLHRLPKEFNFDDMMSLKSYSLFGTYGQTKLANILFMRQLHMRQVVDFRMLEWVVIVVCTCT